MIAGVGGHLVSHAYLEEQVVPELAGTPEAAAFERQAARWWRGVTRSIGPAASARQVFDVAAAPLLDALGYVVPMVHPVSGLLAGLSPGRDGQATLVITTPWATPVDAAWRDAVRGGVAADVAWALVTNGRSLRVVDCRRPWSKHVLRFDFGALLAQPRGAQLLWVLAGPRATLSPAGPDTLRSRVDESSRHSASVCHALSDGVLTALPRLAASLAPRGRAHGRPYDEALTVVYRVLFLLFAEARGLVPTWHPVYRDAYTIEALYQRSIDPRRPRGLWASLQAIARMAHAGCRAGDLDVTAFNGRLFSPRYAPLVEQRLVPEETVKALVLSLTTTSSPMGRRRIAYHDLGVEQLGAVYERVLEHEPAATRTGVVLRRTSPERKATGSFYTPRSITEFMVRRTLYPLVADRSAADIFALRVADPAMGSGAFLVAACHYLADQCEQALVRDGDWRAHDVTPADRAGLRRRVAEQCLYGVDLNPTAVQLARLSLWLTTLAMGRPLTFLDHHLSVGNSLVGGRLADLSRSPVRAGANHPRPLPLFEHDVAAVMARDVLPERLRLAMQPSDSLQAVRDKERTLERLSAFDGPFANWSRAIDAWCAAALWPGAAPAPAVVQEWIASLLGRPTTLPVDQVRPWLRKAAEVAAAHAVFHWELAFPEVFFDAHGQPHADAGFDAVLGNPPWDMLRADTGTAAVRGAERERVAPLRRFFRASGTYTCQGHGHANRYQLFLERALQLTRRGGRCGLILPSGIATDHGSAALRRQLFDRCAIDTWLGFDNRAGIFPIHRGVRFVLVAATAGRRTEVLRFRSGLQDVHTLDRYPSDPRQDPAEALLTVSRARLEAWDSEHLSVPELSSPVALAVLTTAGAAPPLAAAHGWRARFGRELNATDDRPHFIARPSRGRSSALPVVEGKHVTPFQVAIAATATAVPRATAARLIDPASSFARDRIAYRDVASATNRLTLIAGLLPKGVLSTHTLFVQKTPLEPEAQWCLLALLNSLVANYLVRLQVTTHVTTALMARLPVPRPPDGSPAFVELASLARDLARAGIDAAPEAFARLNALVAALYQLTPEQYEHVVASFPLLPRALRDGCAGAYRVSSSPGPTPTA